MVLCGSIPGNEIATRSAGLEELGAGAIVHEIDDAEGPFDLILQSAGGACCFSGSDLREQPRFGVGEVADGGVEPLL